jgi:hypothetical protein
VQDEASSKGKSQAPHVKAARRRHALEDLLFDQDSLLPPPSSIINFILLRVGTLCDPNTPCYHVLLTYSDTVCVSLDIYIVMEKWHFMSFLASLPSSSMIDNKPPINESLSFRFTFAVHGLHTNELVAGVLVRMSTFETSQSRQAPR